MKKYILLTVISLLLSFYVFASPINKRDSLKNIYLHKITTYLVTIDGVTDNLSVYVTHLSKDKKFPKQEWLDIKSKLDSIKTNMAFIHLVPLDTVIDIANISNFRSEYKHFRDAHDLMNNTLTPFNSYVEKDTVYAAQIDYMLTRIERFLTVTGNFKLYLQSLIPNTPTKNIDLGKLIDSLLKKNMPVCKTDTCCNIVKAQTKTTDSLLQIELRIEESQTDNTLYKQYVQASAYTGNVFGVAYFRHVGKPGKAKENNYIGFEFVVPASSTVVGKPGGFLMYGLSEGKLLLQAGIGYLTINPTTNNISISTLTPDGNQTPQTTLSGSAVSTQNRENISWKAAALYSPHKLGLGVSYSPLTKAGVQISYRW
jgi:hypothetical protein